MKHTFMVAALWSLAVLGGVGQPSVAQTQAAKDAAQPGQTSIEGCLAFNGVKYVLGVVGDGPKQYRVIGGDTAALQGKVGHTVQITGVAGKNNPQEMILNPDMREATTGVGWNTITADKVRDVTPNCSYPGFERAQR